MHCDRRRRPEGGTSEEIQLPAWSLACVGTVFRSFPCYNDFEDDGSLQVPEWTSLRPLEMRNTEGAPRRFAISLVLPSRVTR